MTKCPSAIVHRGICHYCGQGLIFSGALEYRLCFAADASGQDEGEEQADEDGQQPGEAAVSKRQACNDAFRPADTGELVQDVEGGYEGCERDCETHAEAGETDEFIEDGHQDDGDGNRVDEEQDRQRYLDDLVEPEIGQEQADDADDRGVFLVRYDGEFFVEEGGDGGDEADGSRETGQCDHDGEEPHADVAKECEGGLGKHVGAEVDMSVAVDLRRNGEVVAEQGQAEIQRAHEHGDGESRHPDADIVGSGGGEGNAAHLVEREDAEGEGGEGVHGVVAFDEAVAEGRGRVFAERRDERRGCVGEKARKHEHDDEQGKERCQDLAETRQQFAWRDGEPPGAGEVEQREDGEWQHAVTADGQYADGERRGCCARDGHEWADGKVDECEQQQREERRDLAAHLGAKATGIEGADDECNDRHADAGEQETKDGRRELAGRLEAE